MTLSCVLFLSHQVEIIFLIIFLRVNVCFKVIGLSESFYQIQIKAATMNYHIFQTIECT